MKRLSIGIAGSLSLSFAFALLLSIPLSVSGQVVEDISWRQVSSKNDASFYDIQDAFNQYWEGIPKTKGSGYKVFKRWENYAAPRVYPTGNLELLSTNYQNYMEWQQSGANKSSGAASSGNWTAIAPSQVPDGYDAGMGRINFIKFDPSNANTMYVSSPDGGLWKSTNGGAAWTTNTDFLPVIGCSDLAIDPTNTQNMYLATGDQGDDRRSIGILKSTNGGSTWNPTSLVWTATDNYRTTRLLMDPTDPQIMMVATDGGIFRTTDGWTTHNQVETAFLTDMEFKPGDPNTVYAAGFEFFKSTDKGLTWTQISSGLPSGNDVLRYALDVTAANAAYVYAIVGDNDGGLLGVYRSTDSGTSFSLRADSPNLLHTNAAPGPSDTGGQAGHDLAIAVSPSNADLVTIGGINQWQSTDGGTNWTRITYWLGFDPAYPNSNDEPEPYIHADIQHIEYLPGSSTTFFTSCDGGISKTTDNGVTWTEITNNLVVGQQTNIALSATNADLMITGLQDIGTLKNDNGNWSVIGGGDGEDGFIDRTNDMNMVYSTVNAAFFLSTDGGTTYSDITGLPSGEWFSPIHQDPVSATTVYAGGFPELYKSTDVLSSPTYSWTQLGTPAGSGNILRFEIAPSNNSVIYAIKENAVSKSTNGGSTFTDVTGNLPVGTAMLANLTLSDTDPDKVWVVFSGYDSGTKVFSTTDGGSSWTNISTGLPNLPMNTIVYSNGSASDGVYIGADIGVYYMDNSLSAWTPFSTDMPNNAVRDLEIFYPTGKIRAATYGRGTWESDLYTPTTSILNAAEKSIKVYPNPVADQLTIEMEGNGQPVTYEILNASGQVISTGTMTSKKVIATGDFAAGVYVIRLDNDKTVQFEKIIKR